MKKYTAIAIAALSLMALSCAKEMPVEIKNDSKVVFTAQIQQQADETKTTLGPAGSSTRVVNWGKDDEIEVFNEANASGVSMGIKNKDSYDPATTAEFAGEISGSNPFYAVYPSAIAGTLSEGKISVALPATQTYAAGTFANGVNPSFAYSNDPDGGSLNFVNLCGVLKLKITSGTTTTAKKIIVTSLKETEMLSGNFNITNLDATPSLEYVDGGSRALTMDLGAGVNLSETATEFYFVVPAGSFASGMVVSVYNDDSIVGSKMTTTAHAITKGKIKNISSINIYEAVINLSASETANCYIVPAAGIYKFYAKAKGNDGNTATDITPASVAHLWSTYNSASAPASKNAIVKNISAVGADGYVSFEATGEKGNVIVAGYSGAGATGNILWSWHLWATDVPTVNQYPSTAWVMDRYLGALSNHYSATDFDDLGFLFQWGRKDPFVNGCIRIPNSAGYADKDWQVNGIPMNGPENLTYESSILKPTTYSSRNIGSWSVEKSVNDPCPVGYSVSTLDEIIANLTVDFDPNKNGYFVLNGTDWFPRGQFRNATCERIYGLPSNSASFYVKDSDEWCSLSGKQMVAKGFAFEIRCVKENH